MADSKLVQRLLEQVHDGDPAQQSAAVDSIRDLSSDPEFRDAFAEAGVVVPLVGLLGSDPGLTLKAALTLRVLAEEQGSRQRIHEAGGIQNFVGILQDGQAHSPELQAAVLRAVLALASEEASSLAFNSADGIPAIVKLIETSGSEELLDMACQLLGRMGHNEVIKNAVRECGGILQMLKRLQQQPPLPPSILETIAQALTILVVENENNQDFVRDNYGIESIVKLLDPKLSTSLASSAATCLTALCIDNDDNKNHVREQWAIPLLVGLLEQEDAALQEKAVDCLRILTTANDLNKLSLFSIPAGVRSLVRIMAQHESHEMITERAAAVIGNLSTTEQFFSAIRECGGLQRLVALLDAGPRSRVTEIAAKTLANMAGNDSSRMGIRLAGGRAPLVHLLTQRPSEEVLLATEEALRRLQIANEERNAILETLRYCDLQQQANVAAKAQPDPEAAAVKSPEPTRPLTQFSVDQTREMLESLGFQDTEVFAQNSVTGGDLLDLSYEEMTGGLALTPLQAKKLGNVKRAFETFEAIAATPGKAEISHYELREWLGKQQRSDEEVVAVVTGFKRALQTDTLPLLSFRDFAVHYQWLMKTLKGMAQATSEPLLSNGIHPDADALDVSESQTESANGSQK